MTNDSNKGAYYHPITENCSDEKKEILESMNKSNGFIDGKIELKETKEQLSTNEEIIDKYKLKSGSCEFFAIAIDDVCNIIKKLEIDIFNLRESLKLSLELNTSYENTIKNQKESIDELTECLQDANDRDSA